MINKNYDKRVIYLQKKYAILSGEYDSLTERIEDLQSDQEIVGSKMKDIEDELKTLKYRMINEKIEELNIETDDPFVRDFILASYFCDKNFERPALSCVNVTNDELQAVDGYKAIRIKNKSIPDELKGKLIKWDARENFENYILEEPHGEFIKLDKVYPKHEDCTFKLENLTTDVFYDRLNVKFLEEHWSGTIMTMQTDVTIGVNKEYLEMALLPFKGEAFNIYCGTPVEPILLENENKSVLLLPIRLSRVAEDGNNERN